MLRVYRFEEPYSVRLRIEGAITAELIPTLEQVWSEVISGAQNRKLAMDASAITHADKEGIAFLVRLQTLGVKVDDDGRVVSRDTHRGAFTRFRHGLCAALCAVMPRLQGCPCEQRA